MADKCLHCSLTINQLIFICKALHPRPTLTHYCSKCRTIDYLNKNYTKTAIVPKNLYFFFYWKYSWFKQIYTFFETFVSLPMNKKQDLLLIYSGIINDDDGDKKNKQKQNKMSQLAHHTFLHSTVIFSPAQLLYTLLRVRDRSFPRPKNN